MAEGIAALITAAGYSSRMGDFKPLLKLGTFTAVERAVRCFRLAGVNDIRVVTGHRAPEVAQALKPYPVQRSGDAPTAVRGHNNISNVRMSPMIINNAGYDRGMYSSVQEGVKRLEPDVRAFFMTPVDTPLVRPDTVQRILASFADRGKPGIIYPVYRGRRGHPTLIAAKYVEEILSGTQPDGLRGLLIRHEDEAVEVEVNDEAVLLDMDTPEDYQNLLQYLEQRAVPSPRECRRILSTAATADQVRDHCLAVARVACILADRLNKSGAGLDKDLVTAGAMLHDVARGRQDHAVAAAQLIEALGYHRVAQVVASHMDITASVTTDVSEAELVFLADKLVKGCQIVSLAERFGSTLKNFSNDPEAVAALKNRWQQASLIKVKVEKILGRPLNGSWRCGADIVCKNTITSRR